MPRLQIEFVHTPNAWLLAFRSLGFEFIFLHSPRGLLSGEREISEYALAHPTAQCTNWVGALQAVNIASRRASNIEAHCLLSSVRLSCLAHCRSQFCAAHRKSLSLHLPQAAVELVSPNVPQSLLGDALNPNKSDIYLAGSRRYIPDLTSGLLLCTAVINLYIYS